MFTSWTSCLVFSVLMVISCKRGNNKPDLPFAISPQAVPVPAGLIDEASGIADSRINEASLWVHQDGGNPADLHLLHYNGTYLKKIHLKGTGNRDWEDMALAPGPGNNTMYIYLADIGDNSLKHEVYSIYRFPEPAGSVDTIAKVEKLDFKYPDGSHDAEAMIVDDDSKDIYIITKNDPGAILYKIPFNQSTSGITTAIKVLTFSFSGAVSAAVSPDRKEIIVKTYSHLYYWKQKQAGSPEALLKEAPQMLAYEIEPQGEAICFRKDNSGFFTLSERALATSVSLNFYSRN